MPPTAPPTPWKSWGTTPQRKEKGGVRGERDERPRRSRVRRVSPDGHPGDEKRTERSGSGEEDAARRGVRVREVCAARAVGSRAPYPSDFAEHAGHDACAVTQLCANGYARDLLHRSVVSAPRPKMPDRARADCARGFRAAVRGTPLPHPRTPSRFTPGVEAHHALFGIRRWPPIHVRAHPRGQRGGRRGARWRRWGTPATRSQIRLARTRFASGAPAASSSSGPQADQTARVLAAASEGRSETFALVHPSSSNGSRGVYLCGRGGQAQKRTAERARHRARETMRAGGGWGLSRRRVRGRGERPASDHERQLLRERARAGRALARRRAPGENAARCRHATVPRRGGGEKSVRGGTRGDRGGPKARSDFFAKHGNVGLYESAGARPHLHRGLASYFESLVAERKAPVVVSALKGRGNGVIAARALRAGEAW